MTKDSEELPPKRLKATHIQELEMKFEKAKKALEEGQRNAELLELFPEIDECVSGFMDVHQKSKEEIDKAFRLYFDQEDC